jgi:hypothetical protein
VGFLSEEALGVKRKKGLGVRSCAPRGDAGCIPAHATSRGLPARPSRACKLREFRLTTAFQAFIFAHSIVTSKHATGMF